MRRYAVLACVGATLVVHAPASAQPVEDAPQAAPRGAHAEAVTPAKLALVRRYLQAIRYEQLIDQTLGAMLPVMAENMARQHPNITTAQQQMVVDTVREVMRTSMTPKMMERMGPIYASTFTEAELQTIVSFYESPAGRAVTAKVPLLAPQAASVVRELMPEMQAEVTQRLCQQFGCDAASSPKPRPS